MYFYFYKYKMLNVQPILHIMQFKKHQNTRLANVKSYQK